MTWISANLDFILSLTWRHIALASPVVLLSLLISVPLGRLANATGWGRRLIVGGSSLLYAIPSLAVFVILPGLIGTRILDPVNVVVALTLYGAALLVRSSYGTGFRAPDMHYLFAGDDYYRTLAEGVDLEPVLNRMGVGRYPNSAMPGEVGNFSVAGHRVTYGKPFNQIAKLQPGDEIVVQTKDGFYTYTFRNFDIILPDAVEVLAPVPDQPEYKGKDRILTLTACNPMFSARERYIAYAELTEWRPAADGPPEAIKDSKAYDKVSKNGGA